MSRIARAPTALPCLAAVGIFLWFGADEGGFALTTWYPGGLALLALLAVTLAGVRLPRPPPLVLAALGLLAAYAAWSYLSIAWAGQKGDALEGAGRTLLYVIVFALFALWPMRERPAALILGVFGLGVAAIGLVELLRADAAANPVGYFLDGRFSEPVGYTNANIALFFMGFWPCAALAARREVNFALRGVLLGAAMLLAGLALIGQSRGWLFVLPVCLVAFVAVMPNRGRLIATLALLGAGSAAVAHPALKVANDAAPDENLAPLVHGATHAILVACAVLTVVGAAVAFADGRIEVATGPARRVSAAAVAAVVLACVIAVGAYSAHSGNPVPQLKDKWTQFKQGGQTPAEGSNRLTTVSTYRYDFWRVAWGNFERHPLAGVGADNFGRYYRQRGRSYQEPRYPHSVELRTLSQTGLVGGLLLLAMLVCSAWAALGGMRRRARPGLAEAVAGASLATVLYWLAHGSLDWFWEFPGLGAPAFALLGLATAVGRPEPEVGDAGPVDRHPRLPAWSAAAALVAGGLVCAAAFTLPWLSERDLDRAAGSWRVDPSGAAKRIDQAASLNPLSSRPYLAGGTYALRLGDLRTARRRFRQALDRDSHDPYALIHLGAIDSEAGHRPAALRFLRQARRENPRSDIAAEALRTVSNGRRLDPQAVNRRFVEDSRQRLGLPSKPKH